MRWRRLFGLGSVPASSYSCSPNAVCSGNPIFGQLQTELNRVRQVYGLPADVATDGKIGVATLAALIKTAQAIDALGMQRDAVLDDYVHYDISGVSPKDLASEADVVLAALKRNGVDPRFGGNLLDPYGSNPQQTTTARRVPPMRLVPTGPTAILPALPGTPSVPALPTIPRLPGLPGLPGAPTSSKLSTGAKIGIGVGVSAVAAAVIAAAVGVAHAVRTA